MFYKISDFVSEWRRESAATQSLLDILTDASLDQAVTPEHRSLGQIGWHLARVIGSMSNMGLDIVQAEGEERAPESAKRIAGEYKRLTQDLLHAVETQWTDHHLLESKFMYGENWLNGATLRFVVQHEVHHRGQMTVLMRQAGLPLEGIYGPTREQWIEQGTQPYI
jgi:uncharacterized damage-inducible protein DinB